MNASGSPEPAGDELPRRPLGESAAVVRLLLVAGVVMQVAGDPQPHPSARGPHLAGLEIAVLLDDLALEVVQGVERVGIARARR